MLGQQEKTQRETVGSGVAVLSVATSYLDHCKAENRTSTYQKRGEFLFDFCFGLPCRFWDYGEGRKVKKPSEGDYLHKGYGKREVSTLIPMDIQKWLDAHPNWGKGTRRMAIQSLKRAFNYCKSMGLISANPIKGMKVSASGRRITYFTDEQEQAIYENSRKALALAIKVCIKTGARYGSEFAKLTAKHVEETPDGMLWRFSPDESKTHKERVIYIPPDVADIVRQQIKRYGKDGPIFRNNLHKPWRIDAMRRGFLRVKERLAAKGIKLDADACLYTCRHTFAKRMLGGYWSGSPITIEVLAGLMGNSRQVCWDHYAKWCGHYTAPFWQAIQAIKAAEVPNQNRD